MNMLRHIFSFKFIIVFALIAFLGAVPKPADAMVKCPCPFAALYKASIAQAKGFGLSNKVDGCFKSDDLFALFGSTSIEGNTCDTGMAVPSQGSTAECSYQFECRTGSGSGIYSYTKRSLSISGEEEEACRFVLKSLAWISGVLPCETPTS
jgi:hypothetical protein